MNRPSGVRPWNVAGATVTLLDRRDVLRESIKSQRIQIEFHNARALAAARKLEFDELCLVDVDAALLLLEPEHFQAVVS